MKDILGIIVFIVFLVIFISWITLPIHVIGMKNDLKEIKELLKRK